MKFKKLIPLFFSFFICLFSIVPYSTKALTDEEQQDMYNTIIDTWNYVNNGIQSGADANAQNAQNKKDMDELKDKVDKMDAEKAIKDYFDNIKEDDKDTEVAPEEQSKQDYKIPTGNTSKKVLAGPRAMAYFASYLMDCVKGMIIVSDPMAQTYVNNSVGGTPLKYGVDISALNDETTALGKLIGVIRVFAYSLVLLLFSVNLVEQTIKFEVFTLKGALRIFGRLLVAKIIIDASAKVCTLIISIIGKLTLQMLDKIQITLNIYPDITMKKSDVAVIGPILDAIAAVVVSIVLMLIIGVILVCVSIVMVKLTLRSIELAMLIVVSPAFFACLSSDVTKEYFKRFLSVFLQVATQTLFMAIAMAVCSGSLNSSPVEIKDMSDLAMALIRVSPTVLITIAMCIVMIKPPKVLTGLVK